MPQWATTILWIAAVITAVGVIWVKLIRPLAKLITLITQALPLLEVINTTFKDNPDAFNVLAEIAAQFRTDNGSSLKDAVNRIEAVGKEAQAVAGNAKAAAEELKVGVKARELLAEQDRKEIRELMLKLDRVSVKVTDGAATGLRIESAASAVANDLEAAHKRADDMSGRRTWRSRRRRIAERDETRRVEMKAEPEGEK